MPEQEPAFAHEAMWGLIISHLAYYGKTLPEYYSWLQFDDLRHYHPDPEPRNGNMVCCNGHRFGVHAQ